MMSWTNATWTIALLFTVGACASQPLMRPSAASAPFDSEIGAQQPPKNQSAARDDPTAPPAPPLPGGSAQTPTKEATICERLARDVRAEVKPIDGGARLTLRPSSAAARMRLRRAADDLEEIMTTHTGAATEPPCALFELAEHGASFRVIEEDDAVLVDVIAKPEDRAAVRAALRRFADATGPAAR